MSQVTCPRSPLSRALDVTVNISRPITEIATDMSMMCFCTPDLDFPPDNGRIRFYSTMTALEQDVAPNSAAWRAGYAFFSRSDRPARMALGRIFEQATPASMTSGAINPANLTGITNGGFSMAVNGAEPVAVGPMDFTSANTVADIASVVNNAMTAYGVSVSSSGTQISLTTTQTGPQAKLDYADAPAAAPASSVSWYKGGDVTDPSSPPTDGSFTMVIDGTSHAITGMNLTDTNTWHTTIKSALTAAGVTGWDVYVGTNVIFTHTLDTAVHTVSVTAGTTGTDAATILGLTAEKGAVSGVTNATASAQDSTYTSGPLDMTAIKALTGTGALTVFVGDTAYSSGEITFSGLTDVASLISALTFTGNVPFTVSAAGDSLRIMAMNGATLSRPSAYSSTASTNYNTLFGFTSAAETWAPYVPAEVDSSYTDVSGLLMLTQGTASGRIDGYTPAGLVSEVQLIDKALRCVNASAYGWAIDAKYRETQEQKDLAAWMEARTAIFGACTNSTLAFNPADTTSIVYYAFNSEFSHTFTFYHNNAQYYPEVSYLACALSVNYAAVDSTLTMKFKQLPGIPVVPMTETELTNLEARRCNTYVAIGNNSSTVRPGVQSALSWYTDSRVNLDNYQEELQTQVYNVFLRNKKVSYTITGQNLLISAAAAVNNRYVQNGTFAPRDVETTENETGYVTYPATNITPVAIYNATMSERSARIAPPIMIRAYEAGAMHSVDITVDVFE